MSLVPLPRFVFPTDPPPFWPRRRCCPVNWQSEFLHILFLVWLVSFLVHKGSSESRDSDDRIEEALHRIEERLDAMEERTQRT